VDEVEEEVNLAKEEGEDEFEAEKEVI